MDYLHFILILLIILQIKSVYCVMNLLFLLSETAFIQEEEKILYKYIITIKLFCKKIMILYLSYI